MLNCACVAPDSMLCGSIHLLGFAYLRKLFLLSVLAVGVCSGTSSAATNDVATTLAGLQEKLAQNPDENVFIRLAELKEGALPAGPLLARYLDCTNWNTRVFAARALGYVGYTNAGSQLAGLLQNEEDWRLVIVAVESLGRLRDQTAVANLSAVAQTHWFSPVRDAATNALAAIEGLATYAPSGGNNWPWFGFDGWAAYQYCNSHAEPVFDVDLGDRGGVLEFGRLFGANRLWNGRLRYTIDVRAVRNIPIKGTGSFHCEEYSTTQRVIPDVALRVADGYIVGRDLGEFGGELAFRDRHGTAFILLGENTAGIFRLGDAIVSVTGLGHMLTNKGVLYRVVRLTDGWHALAWRVLPGAPRCSSLLADGNLFVSCVGGSIVVSPSGQMHMASRAERIAGSQAYDRAGVLGSIAMLGGFAMVFCIGALLFLPYFRAMPYRFVMACTSFLPVVVFFAEIWVNLVRFGRGVFLITLLASLLIGLLVAWRSIATLVQNTPVSRPRKTAFVVTGWCLVAATLWAMTSTWMVGVVLGVS